MTKAQAAALLLAGAAAGVGGKTAFDGAGPGAAQAATAIPFTHAVDLRRDYSADAGEPVRFTVYATERKADGGTKDINAATSCKTTKETDIAARALMNALGRECSWK